MPKTILITGASRGIGLAIAGYLQEKNYQVIGVARNEASYFPGILYTGDLSNAEATQQLFETIHKNHLIDGIVNNVGFARPQTAEEITLADFQAVLDLNLRPAIQALTIFLPHMKSQQWGRIVNIASRAMLGKVGRTSYSTAKAAFGGMTRTLALELAEIGITVNTVAPGPIETEGFYKNYPKNSPEEKAFMAETPMKRIGTPQEVAYAVEFFINMQASFITGQTLFVDGGRSIGVTS